MIEVIDIHTSLCRLRARDGNDHHGDVVLVTAEVRTAPQFSDLAHLTTPLRQIAALRRAAAKRSRRSIQLRCFAMVGTGLTCTGRPPQSCFSYWRSHC